MGEAGALQTWDKVRPTGERDKAVALGACSAALVEVQAAEVLLPARPARLNSTATGPQAVIEAPHRVHPPCHLGPDRDAGEAVELQVAMRVDLFHVDTTSADFHDEEMPDALHPAWTQWPEPPDEDSDHAQDGTGMRSNWL